MLVLVLTISRCLTIFELPSLFQIICGEKALSTPEDKELHYNNNRGHTIHKYTSNCDENIPKDGVLIGVVGAVLARDLQDSGDRRGVVVKNVADLGNRCLYS